MVAFLQMIRAGSVLMKKIYWFLLFLFLLTVTLADREIPIMGFSEVSHHILAILIQTRLLYSPLPAGGIFYRYNFHPRQALRANLFYGGIRANDLDFNNDFQQARAASFSGSVR